MEIAEEDQLEDFDFISEILQVREELENATPSEVPKIADKNHGTLRSCSIMGGPDRVILSPDEILKTCKNIEKFIGERDWEKAKATTIRLKYLDGIKRAASEWRPDSH
jgi:molecular chaperone HscB